MSLSRRMFVRTLGLGSAGALLSPGAIGSGRKVLELKTSLKQQTGLEPRDPRIIQINFNENARGPGRKVIEALQRGISSRIGRGYPPDYRDGLIPTIAEAHDIERENLIIATGSGSILLAGVAAYCSSTKPLVTAEPTYGTPTRMAERLGASVKLIPVTKSLKLDLDAMAQAADGAGLVYLCNPNNPTGTAHISDAVENFVHRIKSSSPTTNILIDEAYIDYTMEPDVKTALPLALQHSGVFITRTFSKAHGMAGLRLGYAVGQPETVRGIGQAWGLGSVDTLSALAGITSLKDLDHIEQERQENRKIRAFMVEVFLDLGFETYNPQTNFIFVNIRRPAKGFREECLEHGVHVGRDFPPLEKTHVRISLGTMEEMQRAVRVFRKVLT